MEYLIFTYDHDKSLIFFRLSANIYANSNFYQLKTRNLNKE